MPERPQNLTDADRRIAAVLGVLLARCKELAQEGSIPLQEVPVLARQGATLRPVEAEEIFWRRFMVKLSRTEAVWEAVRAAIDPLRCDRDIERAIGFEKETPIRADLLLKGPLERILRRYQADHPDWGWDEPHALALVASWRAGERNAGRLRRTIAPLHNFRSRSEELEIAPGLSVRRVSDADRGRLWRRYGAGRPRAPREVTISELEAFEFAIELRWRAEAQPLDDNEAIARVEDLVRALRLHHPGFFGITLIWSGPDPADPWGGDHCGDSLGTGIAAGPVPFLGRMPGELGPNYPPRLGELLAALGRARQNRRLRLVLGRFDSAYERLGAEDRLIDLWIAFEALLLSDTRGELSYRVALRIAQLVGTDGTSRKAAFDTARASYDRRSDVVHGTYVEPGELERITEDTRLLAVEALRAWLLHPPEGGVKGLDHALLNR